jgi:hypothetical protein
VYSKIVKLLDEWVPFFDVLGNILEPVLGQFAPFVVATSIILLVTVCVALFKEWSDRKNLPKKAYLGERDVLSFPDLTVVKSDKWFHRNINPWADWLQAGSLGSCDSFHDQLEAFLRDTGTS